ncbi:MAG: extracellular solute-binding protein [Ruminococcaceae bacterium]|nr:extracellular solute-binding protein [Oscillospiraceae bacterium]
MKHNRTLSILLLSALLASTACGSTGTPANDTTASDGDSVTTTAPVSETTVVNLESSGLEIKDFGGDDFNVFQLDDSSVYFRIDTDESNGEPFNDAIYKRNSKIEEKYNVNIITTLCASNKFNATVRQIVKSGDGEHDLVYGTIEHLFGRSREGLFLDWSTLPYTDLDAKWWNQQIIDQLTVGGKIYVMEGDLSAHSETRVYTMLFNKQMCRDLNLEMPYQLVRDGKWTVDAFKGYITNVNSDLNGDSKMDTEDRWGFLSEYGYAYSQYISDGGRLIDTDSDGNLQIILNEGGNMDRLIDAITLGIDPEITISAQNYWSSDGGKSTDWTSVTAWFASGKAMFRCTGFSAGINLRKHDLDFGVLPYPKYDENQKEYYSCAGYSSGSFAVPITADPAYSSLITEALAIESVSTISPAFYDICLDGKVVRDEESKEMLDIIFASQIYDLGFMCNLMDIRTAVNDLVKNNSTDAASTFAAKMEKGKADLQKLIDDYAKLEA